MERKIYCCGVKLAIFVSMIDPESSLAPLKNGAGITMLGHPSGTKVLRY